MAGLTSSDKDIADMVQQYYRNDSIEGKIKQLMDDPTIEYNKKKELISTLLHPERHDEFAKEMPSELPENLGRMLGLVAGVGTPFFMTQSSDMSPWTRGLLMGLGGIGGTLAGGSIGGAFKGSNIEYGADTLNPASYSPFRGLLHDK